MPSTGPDAQRLGPKINILETSQMIIINCGGCPGACLVAGMGESKNMNSWHHQGSRQPGEKRAIKQADKPIAVPSAIIAQDCQLVKSPFLM